MRVGDWGGLGDKEADFWGKKIMYHNSDKPDGQKPDYIEREKEHLKTQTELLALKLNLIEKANILIKLLNYNEKNINYFYTKYIY